MFSTSVKGPIKAVNLHEVRSAARKRLPRALFDLVDGGSEGESTLRDNDSQFASLRLVPRQASPTAPSTEVTLFGERMSMPILIAPCGAARYMHPDGELALARAAALVGTTYVVPHVSGHSLEAVRAAAPSLPGWYQLYNLGGRQVSEATMDRAIAAGYNTLVVTIDNYGAFRERDMRNGLPALFAQNWRGMMPHLAQFLVRPGWLARYLHAQEMRSSPNIVVNRHPMTADEMALTVGQRASRISWEDIAWIRARWPGNLVIKSVLSASDARQAVDRGADGVIVSNHGGRGLDGAPSSFQMLPVISDAVGAHTVVMLDGAVRRGSDVVKAIAAGAKAVLAGRPFMFALSFGQEGVNQVARMFKSDFTRTLEAMGCATVQDVGPQSVIPAVSKPLPIA